MRYLLKSFIVLLTLIACSCSDSEDYTNPQYSIWDLPHSSFLSLKGPIKSVHEIITEDELRLSLLEIRLDQRGMLTYYNPCIYEIESAQNASKPTTYGWGVVSYAYTYGYNGAGLLSTVQQSGEGELINYTIEYGSHGAYVPMPFEVGDMKFFLIKNVTKVSGDNGFVFTCDGKQAESTVDNGWTGIVTTHYDFNEAGYPTKCKTTTARGETESLVETTYTWGDKDALVKTESINPDDQTREVVDYSPYLLHEPIKKRLYMDNATEPAQTLYYDYSKDGDLTDKHYGVDETGFESTFKNAYSEYDKHGNWNKRVKNEDGMSQESKRTIVYY